MRTLPLSKGLVAVVDDEDYPRLARYKWHVVERGNLRHAMRTVKIGGKRTVYMHREIVGAKTGEEVDHANGNGLDKRRCYLRRCTHRENGRHRRLPSQRKTSRFHGVCWNKSRCRWRVVICAGEPDASGRARQLYVGTFRDEIEAATAYDAAAKTHFGPFAVLNFPAGGSHENV